MQEFKEVAGQDDEPAPALEDNTEGEAGDEQ